MTETANLTNATINILIELNGQVHLVAMKKDSFSAISALVKVSTDTIVKTGKSQIELMDFLGVGRELS